MNNSISLALYLKTTLERTNANMKLRYALAALICFTSFNVLSSNTELFKGSNPWSEIRKERLNTLLPYAMKEANIDAWLIICRENDNDPMAKHIGCENAGKTAVFIFYFSENTQNFKSLAFSPIGEATALNDVNIVDSVIEVARDASAIEMATEFIHTQSFKNIAVNSSDTNPQADGLSHSQYRMLTEYLGKKYTNLLISSEDLIYEFLAVKLPAEVEIMRKAAKLTAQWQIEAYNTIIPGRTTDSDVAEYLKQKMNEYGVLDAWAPSQNPNVVSGTDRGHSHATDRIIQPGDVIQTDFGIRVYDTWVTDIQRFAYVLKEHETTPPDDIAYYWESAKQGRDAAFSSMRSGATGFEVDRAQREVMAARGSLPVMWSTGHPVGYVAHDSGPALNSKSNYANNQKTLKPNMTFAFDGFYKWIMPNGLPKTISVEEMVVIKSDKAEYLIPPQMDLILIKSKRSPTSNEPNF